MVGLSRQCEQCLASLLPNSYTILENISISITVFLACRSRILGRLDGEVRHGSPSLFCDCQDTSKFDRQERLYFLYLYRWPGYRHLRLIGARSARLGLDRGSPVRVFNDQVCPASQLFPSANHLVHITTGWNKHGPSSVSIAKKMQFS
uniref:Uncharacterized protein n=1 Tax=Puccinia triticina (isolate 1-1 / race 1 (BBBD)) TaxID=630390 RepID=A0ABL7D482_PUCT1